MGHKKPCAAALPAFVKTPVVQAKPTAYYSLKPAWHFAGMEFVDPYGWHGVSANELREICTTLGELERLTWREILVRDRHRNHSVEINQLAPPAQKRLRDTGRDMEVIISLRLTGPKRVWGIMRSGVLQLLWWDPEHRVCPSLGADNSN